MCGEGILIELRRKPCIHMVNIVINRYIISNHECSTAASADERFGLRLHAPHTQPRPASTTGYQRSIWATPHHARESRNMPCEIHVALFSASPQSFQLLLKLLQLALHCLRVNLERCAERKAERRGVLDEMRRPGGRGRRLDHLLHLTVDEMRTVTHVPASVDTRNQALCHPQARQIGRPACESRLES